MAVQVRELIDEMIEIKENMKPKEIKINLEKKRRYYEILDKRNKVELIKDSKFIPSKQAKPEAEYRKADRIEKLKEFIKQHCDYKDTTFM